MIVYVTLWLRFVLLSDSVSDTVAPICACDLWRSQHPYDLVLLSSLLMNLVFSARQKEEEECNSLDFDGPESDTCVHTKHLGYRPDLIASCNTVELVCDLLLLLRSVWYHVTGSSVEVWHITPQINVNIYIYTQCFMI